MRCIFLLFLFFASETQHDDDEGDFEYPDGMPIHIDVPDDFSGVSPLPSVHRRAATRREHNKERAETPTRRPTSPKTKVKHKRKTDGDTGSLTNLESDMERLSRQVKQMERQLTEQKQMLTSMEHEYKEEKHRVKDLNKELAKQEKKLLEKRRRASLLEEEDIYFVEEADLDADRERQIRRKEKQRRKKKKRKRKERERRGDELQKEKRAYRKKKKSAKRTTKIDYKALGYNDYKDYRARIKERKSKMYQQPKRRSFSGVDRKFALLPSRRSGRETPQSMDDMRKARGRASGRETPDWLRESRKNRSRREERPPSRQREGPPSVIETVPMKPKRDGPPSVIETREDIPISPPRRRKRPIKKEEIAGEEESIQVWNSGKLMRIGFVPLLSLVVVATLIVVFVVILPGNDKSNTPTPLPPPGTSGRSGSLHHLLPTITQESLLDSSSAQSKALDWLSHDPNLENYSHQRRLQRFALAVVYYSTGGFDWSESSNWLVYGMSECQWMSFARVSACPDGETFEHLELSQNNLRGSIPPEIGLLSNLKTIDMSDNALQGGLPSQFGLLFSLQELALYHTDISGQIPAEIGFLDNLESLQLFETFLSGPIPSELSQIPSLREMLLHLNRLEASIPTELGELSALEKLWLDRNDLTGSIPEQLGSLTNMKELMLFGNSFSGKVPSTLGMATSLVRLELVDNSLIGGIPESLCSLFESSTLQLISVDCKTVSCDCGCTCG